MVALRKESVDRNTLYHIKALKQFLSLSARRAWIEIIGTATALNTSRGSLSARRAWIEITFSASKTPSNWSLSARRAWIEILFPFPLYNYIISRSPQGERG